MELSEQDIVQQLLMTDEEFRSLHKQHSEMKQVLASFSNKPYLSPSDEVEVKRIKKKKLLGKDEMYRKISEYKRSLDA